MARKKLIVRDEQGKFLRTDVFREAALYFSKHGCYTPDPYLSPGWYDYWREQRRRIMDGYSVAGVKITGEHYFYLNFCPIKKAEDTSKHKTKKVTDFPDFWDGDYQYFWCRQIAKEGLIESLDIDNKTKKEYYTATDEEKEKILEELFKTLKLQVKIKGKNLKGGWNLIVGKSRRRGYSYKAGAVGARNYFTKPASLTIYAAYEKGFLYPNGVFSICKNFIDFINDNTAFTMPSDTIDRQNHLRASYIEYKDGVKIEKGFKSEILAISFKDDADKARGKDAEDIFFEEAGAFGTPELLKNSYAATEDCVRAGTLKTGMITIFGTSGDILGGTADYAEMFLSPEKFGCLPMANIWDEGYEDSECGFFHPTNWNSEGFYDENGNSDFEGAKNIEIKERERLKALGSSSSQIQRRMQERPLGPHEAFAAISVNTFPIVELTRQLEKVRANDWQNTKGKPVEIFYSDGKVRIKPILKACNPITSFRNVPEDKSGVVIMYEEAVDNPPKGLYKIGYDPVRQDSGTSLAAIVVYKGIRKGDFTKNRIVAEYIGRKNTTEDIDRIAELLAVYYNTQIMYENEVTGTKNYFRRIRRLDLLAVQPDAVISKNIKESKVARVYGCHMNASLKDAGERYVNDWLLDVADFDENGSPILNLEYIYSIRFLEELISYYRKGNFDYISAFFMCMFQAQEESLGKEYSQKENNSNARNLIQMIGTMYR